MISAADALRRLRDGNQRFVAGTSNIDEALSSARRAELVDGQTPFAVVLACSDSRVPVELIFDQGLGSLFVIRVAGNVVAPSQIGSVEFAAAQLGTRFVVVLGHSNCGAVDAALAELTQG
ncbi:MAG: carbonic anhydrase, partial [Gammaproteobacteria bacterium]|nr:carbonic anhydrase [Gammaproteobacteria bacterium]